MNIMNWIKIWVIKLSIVCCSCGYGMTEKIPIKIVDEPMNYEHGNVESNAAELVPVIEADTSWLSTVHPAYFTGPEQLKQLDGRCFSWNNSKYRYDFCPFHNITQQEISATWNPYHGVLGVWGEWSIRENKFLEMIYLQGDSCESGVGNRSVKVQLDCQEGILGNITEVSEPDRCLYRLTFSTQLVCHPHAMLVYPRLPREQQQAWDQLFSEHTRAEITDKGLELGLQQLFQTTEFFLSEEAKQKLRTAPKSRPSTSHLARSPCELQLERLRAELQTLQEEIAKLRKSDGDQ
ncbi:hypothetical protein B566_EDAN012637 [Ephemera danica]|nr:hypothetical protein B566_EDAN012637 [Ephemera danica]